MKSIYQKQTDQHRSVRCLKLGLKVEHKDFISATPCTPNKCSKTTQRRWRTLPC